MMEINERQKDILNSLIEEYIDSAVPVSSHLLEKKYNFGLSPATIRIELQRLTDGGLIFQPHTSAGRVPTDRGYRFFVNELMQDNGLMGSFEFEKRFFDASNDDGVRLIQLLTKKLADVSSNLALGYLVEEKILWKEGWENILLEPEFKEENTVHHFSQIVRNFEREIEAFDFDSMKIFIGEENPWPQTKEFSVIIEKCDLPNDKEGVLAIIGPKRMTYDKNIGFLNSLVKLMSNT